MRPDLEQIRVWWEELSCDEAADIWRHMPRGCVPEEDDAASEEKFFELLKTVKEEYID